MSTGSGSVRIEADVVVVGAGPAGLVAAAELADAGKRVVPVEQEPEASSGGQAWWSLGGLFLVDTPEQRRLRVHGSRTRPARSRGPGGRGMRGNRSLGGTFLGGCLSSGRVAGRPVAAAL